ncbi:DUF1285 domain-containing protein [Oricola sp.]|uniref:DUF1285 domain-containing protein n=1 Tax=Oricola sp. TaxID=1979950 RepID=UPI0026C69069|tara:strand:+ start:1270 stop:1908 length:639 start_codon:yes stop_codon:yes gene_type:complete
MMKKTTKSGEEKAAASAPGDIAGLQALLSRATQGGKGLPPVDKWNPPDCGAIDMRIRADGTWFYLGTPIGRMPLVRLFSTVLRKDEDGKTYLVTPVEKIEIEVEDAPFLAVEMHVDNRGPDQVLTFRTNVGDVIEAGPEHALRFEQEEGSDGLKPYLHVRGRLEALVTRALMYDLVELGETLMVDGREVFAVRSGGTVFSVMPTDELERSVT